MSKAMELAEWIEGDMTCQGDAEIAAELRRLAAVEKELAAIRALEPVAWLHKSILGSVQAFTTEPPPGLKEKCKPLVALPEQK